MLNNTTASTKSLTRFFEGSINAGLFSPHGDLFAISGLASRGVNVFGASQLFSSTAQPLARISKDTRVKVRSFSPSGKLLAASNRRFTDAKLVVHKVGGEWEEVWHSRTLHSSAVCFLWASEHQIVTEEGDWIDLEADAIRSGTFRHRWDGTAWNMDVMRNHQLAAISVSGGELFVIDLRTEKMIHNDRLHSRSVNNVSASLDEKLLLSSSNYSDKGVVVRDVRTWKPIFESPSPSSQARFFFNSQPHLATSIYSGAGIRSYPEHCQSVQLWDASTGRLQLSYYLKEESDRNCSNIDIAGTDNIVTVTSIAHNYWRGRLHVLATQ